MTKRELEKIRLFLVSLTSACIQNVTCTSLVDCLAKAEKQVNEQMPGIKSFLDRVCESADITSGGLVIRTKPLIHELFYDKNDDSLYSRPTWYYQKRDKLYDVGRVFLELYLSGLQIKIRFENKEFIHGHINTEGTVTCWATYGGLTYCVQKEGPLGALQRMYSFAKFSRYGSRTKQEELEHARIRS